MLQMFHLYVLKIDQALHILQCALDERGRPGDATRAPLYFTCGCEAWFQTLAHDAGGRGVRAAFERMPCSGRPDASSFEKTLRELKQKP